jgi:antibiotic biosynthesis monooxygenase (ABM) superfamily enzyme
MTTLTISKTPTVFSRPRFALLVLLGVYPFITALQYVVGSLTGGWPLWERSLLIAPVMVVGMIWGVIPAVHRLFRGFINPAIESTESPQDGGA